MEIFEKMLVLRIIIVGMLCADDEAPFYVVARYNQVAHISDHRTVEGGKCLCGVKFITKKPGSLFHNLKPQVYMICYLVAYIVEFMPEILFKN